MDAVKLDQAAMRKLLDDHMQAEIAGDVDAAMEYLTPDAQLEIAGLHLKGAAEIADYKTRWIANWVPRWKSVDVTIDYYDEEKQMAVQEASFEQEDEDGVVRRYNSVVVFEFEDGLMSHERLYCTDPGLIAFIRRAAGVA